MRRKNAKRLHANSERKQSRPRRRALKRTFERLEPRNLFAAPGIDVWSGSGADTTWENTQNWIINGSTNHPVTAPGAAGTQDIGVDFRTDANTPAPDKTVQLTDNRTVAGLTVGDAQVVLGLQKSNLAVAGDLTLIGADASQNTSLSITAPKAIEDNNLKYIGATLSANDVYVGSYNTAKFSMKGGILNIAKNLGDGFAINGTNQSADGSVTLNNTVVSVGGAVNVGQKLQNGSNTGSLNIMYGTVLTSSQSTITEGQVVVQGGNGVDSSWDVQGSTDVSGTLDVGNRFGPASLYIYSGGSVSTAGNLLIDGAPGAATPNQVVVDGNGEGTPGHLTVDGEIDGSVAGGGGGNLTIQYGGVVTSAGGMLGSALAPNHQPGAVDNNVTAVAITEKGVWNISGPLNFGDSAQSTVTLYGGGQIDEVLPGDTEASNPVNIFEGPDGILRGGGTNTGIFAPNTEAKDDDDFYTAIGSEIIPAASAANPIGTLTLDANIITTAGGTIETALGAPSTQPAPGAAPTIGQSARLTTPATVALGGKTQLTISSATSRNYALGQTFDVIHADLGITGTIAQNNFNFTAAPLSNANWTWEIVYQKGQAKDADGNPIITDILVRVVDKNAPKINYLQGGQIPIGGLPSGQNSVGLVVSAGEFFAQNVSASGVIQSVTFYQSSDGTFANATVLGTGTQAQNGLWNFEVDNANAIFTGDPVTFFATASDDAGQVSPAFKMTDDPIINLDTGLWTGGYQPDYGEYQAHPGDVYGVPTSDLPQITSVTTLVTSESGSAFQQFTTLTASGVTGGDGNAIASVSFYGASFNGPDDGPYLGSYIGTVDQADDGGNWSLSVPTAGVSEGVFAVATDASGQQTVLTFGSAPYSPPVSSGLTATASSDSTTVTLSATYPSPFAGAPTVQSVAFYQDTTGVGPADPDLAADNYIGSGTYSNNTWTLTVNTSSLSAGYDVFYAVATDSDGVKSAPVFAYLDPDPAPTIGSFTASSDRYSGGDDLTLTASNVFDADNLLQGVDFFQDLSGTGVYNYNTANYIGTGTFDGSGYSLNVGTTNFSGPQTFFAIAIGEDQESSGSH
jgi:hypothetical protein